MGIIYIIRDNETEETYVGSTTMRLHQRMNAHKSGCKRHDEGKKASGCSSFPIIRRGNYKAEILQTMDTEDKIELRKVETEWIRKLNPINTMKKAYASVEEKKATKLLYQQKNKEKITDQRKGHYQDNKETIAERRKGHYQDNKEQRNEYLKEHKIEIAEKSKVYRKDNKVEIAEKKKIYQQEHKVEIAEKMKIYRQEHKAEINDYHKEWYKNNKASGRYEKIECPCGGSYCVNNQPRHFKTKKHMAFTGI